MDTVELGELFGVKGFRGPVFLRGDADFHEEFIELVRAVSPSTEILDAPGTSFDEAVRGLSRPRVTRVGDAALAKQLLTHLSRYSRAMPWLSVYLIAPEDGRPASGIVLEGAAPANGQSLRLSVPDTEGADLLPTVNTLRELGLIADDSAA